MKPHKHAELIKTWLDNQDAVSFQGKANDKWVHVDISFLINESYVCAYRIDPNCEYAIEKIRELGGAEAVEIYKYWLGGGNLAIIGECSVSGKILDYVKPPQEDPFNEFVNLPLSLVSKKKQTVKQVLWVYYSKNGGDMSCPMLWVVEGENIQAGCWHKVPTCTREVEV